MPKRIEIEVGSVFNDLEFLYEVDTPQRARKGMFRCKCGITKVQDINNVRTNRTRSCGCGQVKSRHKHGHCTGKYSKGTSLYRRWSSFKDRCNNPECVDYPRYGGRGITICEEWSSFPEFAKWAESSGYSENLTIDRRDNNKGYSPDNCRWVGLNVQAANQNKTTKTMFKYIGVRHLPSGNWHAIITHKGVVHQLGSHPTEEAAVITCNNYIRERNLPHTIQEIQET